MKGIHARNVFGTNLKRRRKELGKTQIEFAELLGITQGALSQLESGTKGFNSDTITDIAAALKCKLWELLIDPDQNAKSPKLDNRNAETIQIHEKTIREQLGVIIDQKRELDELKKRHNQPSELELTFQSASELRREAALAILRKDTRKLRALLEAMEADEA